MIFDNRKGGTESKWSIDLRLISRLFYFLAFAGLIMPIVNAASSERTGTADLKPNLSGPYQPEWESFKKAKGIPRWYIDAKFGIYAHWGPYSVPMEGTAWYGYFAYRTEDEVDSVFRGNDLFVGIRRRHLENYGPLDRFGYKDFIPMFTAEHFHPEEWAQLVAESGARYFLGVAEHHDGFAMYDSAVTRWNAVKMGPGRDVIGELAKAMRERGLHFGVTSHRSWHWRQYMYKDEYDTMDPANWGLYWKPHNPDQWPPSPDFIKDELDRCIDLINKYQPDIFWFDAGPEHAAYDEFRRTFAAHYLNVARECGQEVVINTKAADFPMNIAVLDIEAGGAEQIREQYWQTDMSITSAEWHYSPQFGTRTAREIIHFLMDNVSKNGALLLNITPRPDGRIPLRQSDVLKEIGRWLQVNGEAVYATRPYKIFGEGPGLSGHFQSDLPVNVRYTTKGTTLYVTLLDWPSFPLKFQHINVKSWTDRSTVGLLGCKTPLAWQVEDGKLTVTLPDLAPFQRPSRYAYVLKIEGFLL